MDKPFKGRIIAVEKKMCGDTHYYRCCFIDHPVFQGSYGHTSGVVWEGEVMNDKGEYEIETFNSRYVVIPS